jgi:hypothetical protein
MGRDAKIGGNVYDGVWRSGKRLVMRGDATLPDRCVMTNRPAYGQRVQLRVRWHHPVIYLALLANLILYLILAAVLSKTAFIRVGISDAALRVKRSTTIVSWVLAIGGLVAMVLGAVDERFGLLFFPGAAAMFVAIPVYLWGGARLVVPSRIEDGYVWLSGVHPDYLDSLPSWDGVSGWGPFA